MFMREDIPVAEGSAQRGGLFYGWIMVAVAFVAQGVSAGGLTYSYSVITVTLNDEFEVSRLQLMLPMTAMTLVGAFISPLLGPRLDSNPIKWFMFAGAMCLGLGLWLMSLVPSMPYVVAIYALLMAPVQGLLGALCCSVLLSRWFSSKLALAMGVAAIGTSIGGFAIPPLIEWLNQSYGWREGMRYMSMAVFFAVVPLTLLVCDRPALKGLFPDGASADPVLPNAMITSVFNNTKVILRSRQFWLLSLTMGFLFSAFTALITNLLQLVMAHEVSRQDGTFLISLMSAIGIAGKLGFGAIADRVDLRKALAASVVLVMLGLGIYMLGSTYSHYVLGSVALGLSVGGMLPVWGALIAKLFGATNYGRVMGMMGPVIVLCNVVAVPLTGFLYDQYTSYVPAFSLFIALLAVSLLWIPMIKNSESK